VNPEGRGAATVVKLASVKRFLFSQGRARDEFFEIFIQTATPFVMQLRFSSPGGGIYDG